MKTVRLGLAIGAAAPLALAGVFANTSPAQAFSISPGDELFITGEVLRQPAGGPGTADRFLFLDADGDPAPVGEYGNFSATPASSGSFQELVAVEAFGVPGYEIRSVSFSESFTGDIPEAPGGAVSLIPNFDEPFLQLDAPDDDQVNFFLDEVTFLESRPLSGTGNFQTTIAGTGFFESEETGEIIGFGSINSTFEAGEELVSYEGAFTAIPEPTTMAGLGLALGLGSFLKKQRANKQQ